MKVLIKFFITASLLVVFSLDCMPQIFESDNIEVSATVMSVLSIANDVDVDFGSISGTTAGEVFLDPQGTENSYVGVTATAGHFIIVGETSQIVRIGWPDSITLTAGEGEEMTLTFAVSGNGTDDQSTSLDLTAEDGYTTVEIYSGAYYLWVGGSLGPLTNQEPGTYTGNADFTVEYN